MLELMVITDMVTHIITRVNSTYVIALDLGLGVGLYMFGAFFSFAGIRT